MINALNILLIIVSVFAITSCRGIYKENSSGRKEGLVKEESYSFSSPQNPTSAAAITDVVGINNVFLGKQATPAQLDTLLIDSKYLHKDGGVLFNVDGSHLIKELQFNTVTTVEDGIVDGFTDKFNNTFFYKGRELKTEEEVIGFLFELKDTLEEDKYKLDYADESNFTLVIYEQGYEVELYKSNEYVNITLRVREEK